MSTATEFIDHPIGGFNFDGYARNEQLFSKGFAKPKYTKTGTTICGIIFADGVILGSDTRATSGSIVAEKNCLKLHPISKYIYAAGAGTAADCAQVTGMVASQVALHGLNNNQEMVPIEVAVTAAKRHLFRYQGYVGAYLIFGGVDKNGGHIEEVSAGGNTQAQPFAATGSGSYNAIAVLEARWKPNLSLDEGKKLVRDAIAAGVFNDLGSGSNIDLCVITKNGSQLMRAYEVANVKGQRQGDYTVKAGATRTELTTSLPIVVEDVMVRQVDVPESPDDMDTSL